MSTTTSSAAVAAASSSAAAATSASASTATASLNSVGKYKLVFLGYSDERNKFVSYYGAAHISKKPSTGSKLSFLKVLEVSATGIYRIEFLRGNLNNCFLSRLAGMVLDKDSEKLTPKAKFVRTEDNRLIVASRFPPRFYNRTISAEVMKKHTLFYALDREVQTPIKKTKLSGILEAVIFGILIEDCDRKTSNYAAYFVQYPEGVREYKVEYAVRPFDFEHTFGNRPTFSKSWTEEQIRSLIGGTGTQSRKASVAEALAETFGEFGVRTTGYYQQFGIENKDTLQSIVMRELARELSEIRIYGSIVPSDHSIALIIAFQKVLKSMFENVDAAISRVLEDTRGKLDASVFQNYNGIDAFFREQKAKLMESLNKFYDILNTISIERGLTPLSIARAGVVDSAGRSAADSSAAAAATRRFSSEEEELDGDEGLRASAVASAGAGAAAAAIAYTSSRGGGGGGGGGELCGDSWMYTPPVVSIRSADSSAASGAASAAASATAAGAGVSVSVAPPPPSLQAATAAAGAGTVNAIDATTPSAIAVGHRIINPCIARGGGFDNGCG